MALSFHPRYLSAFVIGMVIWMVVSSSSFLYFPKEIALAREECNFKTLLIPGLRGPVLDGSQVPRTVDFSRLGNAESSCWSEYQNIYSPQGKIQEQRDTRTCKVGSYPLVVYDGLILEGVSNVPKDYHTQGVVPDIGEEWDHFTALFFGPATTDDLKFDENLFHRNFSCHFEETGQTVNAHVSLRCNDYHTGCMRLLTLRCGLTSSAVAIYSKAHQVNVRVCDDTCGMCVRPMILRGQSTVKGDLGVVVTSRLVASSPAERMGKIARLVTWMHHYLTQGATHFIWIDNGQFAEGESLISFLLLVHRKRSPTRNGP